MGTTVNSTFATLASNVSGYLRFGLSVRWAELRLQSRDSPEVHNERAWNDFVSDVYPEIVTPAERGLCAHPRL
jgi:hypothetical protein